MIMMLVQSKTLLPEYRVPKVYSEIFYNMCLIGKKWYLIKGINKLLKSQHLPEEEESSSSEDENEYFPPPGLLIPGFYAPPNDIAKTNGLAVLFPKVNVVNICL